MAADAQQGWSGVSFLPGAFGELKDSFVGGAKNSNPFLKGSATLRVIDASLTLKGTTLQGVVGGSKAGIIVSGPSSNVAVLQQSQIQGHDGAGLVVLSDASARWWTIARSP